MLSKKYKLGERDKVTGLYPVIAQRDFNNVKKGERGGYVSGEHNLSQIDNSWVYGNALVCGDALVYGKARVYGDALVYGNARVYGDAWVYDDARVCGNARVCGDAWVYGNAQVYGNALVYGNARVYGDAWVYGDARVYGDAWVYGDARVYGNALVHGDALVCGDALVYGDARMNGLVAVNSSVWQHSGGFALITSVGYVVKVISSTEVAIGCTSFTFKKLYREGEKLAREHGLRRAQYNELKFYVDMAYEWVNRYKKTTRRLQRERKI